MRDTKQTYVFANGSSIEGTIEQLSQIAAILGETLEASKLKIIPDGYYASSTKGLMKIEDMATYHIKNAICRRTIDYLEEIQKEKIKGTDFIKKFLALAENEQLVSLFEVLNKRTD